MKLRSLAFSVWAVATLAICLALPPAAPAAQGQQPKKGGTLVFTIPADSIPSMDGHREETFAVMHAIAPHYSLLIRPDTTDPTANKLVGDLATKWTVSKDKLSYTFTLRKGVKFHDGSPCTAKDVVASFNHIIFPPQGVLSSRQAYFAMVDSVSAPNPTTVVFKLKFTSNAFLPAVANPFNWIYKAELLAKDPHWYETNVMGTGPFLLKEQNPGANWVGVRNPQYFFKGRPYMDGYEAIYTPKQNVEVNAMRGGRSLIQFRGFPPDVRDQLQKDLGGNLRVQESTWNCSLYATANPFKKPFDDVRVRRALNLAIDRWGGSNDLSKVAIVRTVGGYVFPGNPMAMSKDELTKIEGYWTDIEASRKEARRLLKEAGVPQGFKFKLHNRDTEQPYKYVAIWLVDQWAQVGLTAEQWIEPTAPFYATLRKNPPDFDVTMDFNCQSIVNPQLDISKFLSEGRSKQNYGHYVDPTLDKIFDDQVREADPAKVKALLKQFEERMVDQGHYMTTLWWNRIITSSTKVQSWTITPSHYINNQLDDVWLTQ